MAEQKVDPEDFYPFIDIRNYEIFESGADTTKNALCRFGKTFFSHDDSILKRNKSRPR